MHPRNLHRERYNFPELIKTSPDLKSHIVPNKMGESSINFDRPDSVRALNKAILLHFYGIKDWNIPESYLFPPIPGRADYLHHLADLFDGGGKLRGLDIGVGANCIYPLLGHKSYGWAFVGSDIDPVALAAADKILKSNMLEDKIELRLQSSKNKIFTGILKDHERFDFSMSNPPFHSSAQEALAGTDRKRKNLGLSGPTKLNFGGKSNELWCKGGERLFIDQMIIESSHHPQSITWYTTLISKELNVPYLIKRAKAMKTRDVRVIEMILGQKKSRILAWTFL